VLDLLISVVVCGDLETRRNNIVLKGRYIGGLPDRIPKSPIILNRLSARLDSDLCGDTRNRMGTRRALGSQLLGGSLVVPISLGSLIGA